MLNHHPDKVRMIETEVLTIALPITLHLGNKMIEIETITVGLMTAIVKINAVNKVIELQVIEILIKEVRIGIVAENLIIKNIIKGF